MFEGSTDSMCLIQFPCMFGMFEHFLQNLQNLEFTNAKFLLYMIRNFDSVNSLNLIPIYKVKACKRKKPELSHAK
jgi:hypothetical protein